MKIIDILLKLIDWLIPGEFHQNKDKLMRGRLVVITAFALIFIWLPTVFRNGALSIAIMIVLEILVIFLLFLQYKTGSIAWPAHGLVLVFSFGYLYWVYWAGGYQATLLRWSCLAPVLAVVLLGNKGGFFWLIVNIIGVNAYRYLENSGVKMPVIEHLTYTGIYYCFLGLLAFVIIYFLALDKLRENALITSREETEKSKKLAMDMQMIVEEIKNNASSLSASTDDLTISSRNMKVEAEQIEKNE
ncbi:hypothetical protein KKA14_20855, partial [bacterium]|nr:hypothetical protein [bacterium]